MKIEDFKLAYELIDVLMQTRNWETIRRNDPRIQAGKTRLKAAIAGISDKVDDNLLGELEAAVMDLQEASADAATLYGIRIAGIIQEVLDNQLVFSQMFLEQSAKCAT